MCSWRNALGCRETTFSVPTARPLATSGRIRAELRPALWSTLMSRKSGAPMLVSALLLALALPFALAAARAPAAAPQS